MNSVSNIKCLIISNSLTYEKKIELKKIDVYKRQVLECHLTHIKYYIGTDTSIVIFFNFRLYIIIRNTSYPFFQFEFLIFSKYHTNMEIWLKKTKKRVKCHISEKTANINNVFVSHTSHSFSMLNWSSGSWTITFLQFFIFHSSFTRYWTLSQGMNEVKVSSFRDVWKPNSTYRFHSENWRLVMHKIKTNCLDSFK